MKSLQLLYPTLLICFLTISSQLSAKNLHANFKPGDWFECEMEFENHVPVFRNHWSSEDNKHIRNQLISIQFTYSDLSNDTLDVWEYKVLRYRYLNYYLTKIGFTQSNINFFDTWYPDIFDENAKNDRDSLVGTISFNERGIYKHSLCYSKLKFSAPTLFPYFDNAGRVFSSSMGVNPKNIEILVESVASIMFHTSILKANMRNRFKWEWIDDVQWRGKEVEFTIHQNGSNPDHITNDCKANLLDNGLPYAFTDRNGHKVFAITNASFDIPNKVELKIIDKRDSSTFSPNRFNNLMAFSPHNKANVYDESGIKGFVELINNESVKTFSLKAGTEFDLGVIHLFVLPGDSFSIILEDDGKVKIEGNNNNEWFIKRKWKEDTQSIINAPVSDEIKTYLTTNLKMKELVLKIDQTKKDYSLDNYRDEFLNLFFIKSYNDKMFKELLLTLYRKSVEENHRNGSIFRTGIINRYYKAVSNLSNIQLYTVLNDLLCSQYAQHYMAFENDYFNSFITQCGDTTLKSELLETMQGVESIKKGKKIPIQNVLSENNDTINLMPPQDEYTLLHIYNLEAQKNEFKEFSDSLDESIHCVSYLTNRDWIIKSDKPLNIKSIKNQKYLHVYGHKIENVKILKLTGNRFSAGTVILFNAVGEIIYSSVYERKGSAYNEHNSYVDEINTAIEAYENQKNKRWQEDLLVIGSILLIITLLLIFYYRIRISRLKKRNAQKQLLEELKLQSVQSQLNPHFLFNALNSIQNLINSGNNVEANAYLIGFSDLLRGVLQNANKRLVPLSDELKMIERYCELERLRVDFNCAVNIDTQTNIDIIEIPFMLLQPIVENAIKYGVSSAKIKGLLTIDVRESGMNVIISVRDNGSGFEDINLDILKRKGKGLHLCSEKLETIYGNDASMHLSNTELGAEVQLKLKIG